MAGGSAQQVFRAAFETHRPRCLDVAAIAPTFPSTSPRLLHSQAAQQRHSGQLMRIAIGGFQHETNTFAPSKATFDNFVRGGGWPPLLIGDQIFDGVKGMNLPIAGFIDEMAHSTHKLVPIAWSAAPPSAHVTEDAFEKISKLIVD